MELKWRNEKEKEEKNSIFTLMDLLSYYKSIKPEIDARLKTFKFNWHAENLYTKAREEDHFLDLWIEEMIFCMCTPQTSPLRAHKAIQKIKIMGSLTSYANISLDTIHKGLMEASVRFHNVKSQRIYNFLHMDLELFKSDIIYFLRREYSLLNAPMGFSPNDLPVETAMHELVRLFRNSIANRYIGIGLKEASHFMRNMGYGKYVAILDRHVMRKLEEYKVIPKDTKLTKKNYYAIEAKMIAFADRVAIPMDALDFVFWHQAKGFIFK